MQNYKKKIILKCKNYFKNYIRINKIYLKSYTEDYSCRDKIKDRLSLTNIHVYKYLIFQQKLIVLLQGMLFLGFNFPTGFTFVDKCT